MGAAAVSGVAGADGNAIRLTDVEFGWTLTNDDLKGPTYTTHGTNPGDTHGTNALGIVLARKDGRADDQEVALDRTRGDFDAQHVAHAGAERAARRAPD